MGGRKDQLMLKFSHAAVDWAIDKLGQLQSKRGFPDAEGLESDANALLRIAHPVIVQARLGMAKIVDGWNQGEPYGSYIPTQQDTITDPKDLQDVLVGLNFGMGDKVNPLDWLVEKAVDKLEFYPAPIKLRRLFIREFPPADGEFYAEEE